MSNRIVLFNQIRWIQSRSARNKSTRLIGKHKEPRTEEQRDRMINKNKAFVLGRDNVKRNFEPIRIPDEALNTISKDTANYDVLRTSNGALPVYTEYKNGRSRILTIIRRIEGDLHNLRDDLCKFIPSESVQIKQPQNHIVIQGNKQRSVRYWLTAIGF